MGRQAYLTKIAFGRSAFEPAQITASTSEYVQLASAQQERAHEHGRCLREAQNDVLASIGVVERRRSPSRGLPGSYDEQLRMIEDESTAGYLVAMNSSLMRCVFTWPIASLRHRFLTFDYPNVYSFFQILTSEKHLGGNSWPYNGFLCHHLSQLGLHTVITGVHVLRPLDRLLIKRGTLTSKNVYRQWRTVLNATFRISLELLFYPLSYYSCVQRLGIASEKLVLPSLKSFIPFSKSSPLTPFSVYHDALVSPMTFLKSFLTSPFVFMFLENVFERWIIDMIEEPIETAVIQPSNPDIISPTDGNRQQVVTSLISRRSTPRLLRTTISKLLGFIGWGGVTGSSAHRHISIDSHGSELQGGDTIEVGGRQISHINRPEVLDVPRDVLVPEPEAVETITIPVSSLSEALPPPTPSSPPLSPTASQASHNDGDPRIRITARGDLVQMEVRLPPHVLSSHTEIAGSGPPTPIEHAVASPLPMQTSGLIPYHRVTKLSMQPSSLIGSICKAQIVSLVSLPLRMVTLRLVASHYLAAHPEQASARKVSSLLVLPNRLDLKSVGVFLSRIALCGLLELAIDLTVWGYDYWLVSKIGKNEFNWGAM